MADTKQFSRLTKITKGNTPSTDLKMTDIFAMQHIDLPSGANAYKQVSLAQSLCEPIAVTPNSTPSDGAYTATCSNYPDFSLTYTDANGNSHYLIGLKVRVVFTKGITYGSVSGGTYPTLNINGSGAIPLLAQGMTMAKGAAQNGQTIEFTIIPYGNGVAFDADSNVRESTSDYTIYTDGTITYTKTQIDATFATNTADYAKSRISRLQSIDVRDANISITPIDFIRRGYGLFSDFIDEFKLLGYGSQYQFFSLLTIVPWSDATGGLPYQIAFPQSNGQVLIRRATNVDNWGAWAILITVN